MTHSPHVNPLSGFSEIEMRTTTISYDGQWEAKVEIADDAEPKMREQLMYWAGGEYRLASAGGEVERAFLIMLGQALVREAMDYTIEGVLARFADREGWYPLDGSAGVRLVSIDNWEFYEDEFELKSNGEGQRRA